MREYVKPIITLDSGLAEGVYAASGSTGDDSGDKGQKKCDSKYMKGVWQAPDYSGWNGGTRGYKQQFACLGCPANTSNGCGLLTHYEDSGHAGSYDVDDGNRMPTWEKKGYGPDDVVTDWAM